MTISLSQVAATAPAAWPTYVDLAIKAVTLLVVVVSVTIAFSQFRRAHEWNRRKASLDLAFEIVNGRRADTVRHLATRYGMVIGDANTRTYQDVVASLKTPEERADFLVTVRWLLNHAESIAIGLKNHVLDEEITYDHSSLVIARFWEWAQPHIKAAQAADPTVWIDQQYFVERWTKRELATIANLRNPGKNPT